MHEILLALSRLQTLSNIRSYIISLTIIIGLCLIIWALAGDIWWLSITATIASAAIISVGIFVFLEGPVQWTSFLIQKAFILSISIFAASIRVVAYGLAAVLSVVYFIWPLDLITDIIIIFGWIEDVAIAIGLFSVARSADIEMPYISTNIKPLEDIPRLVVSSFLGIILAVLLRYIFS